MNDLEVIRGYLGKEIKIKTPIRSFRRILREDQKGFYVFERNEKCYLDYKIYRVEGYKPVVDFLSASWTEK